MPRDRGSGTQSLERLCSLMRAVAAAGERGQRLADVAETTGLNAATAHRMLRVLVLSDVVEQDPATHLYFPGPAMLRLGEAAQERYPIGRIAREPLHELSEWVEDVTYLMVRRGNDAVCVARAYAGRQSRSLAFTSWIRNPLGYGTGSIPLVAYLPEEELRAVLDANAHLLRHEPNWSPTLIAERVASMRRNGYFSTQNRSIEGLTVISFGVEHDGDPGFAALTCFCQTIRLQGEFRTAFFERARAAISRIQAGLAHHAGRGLVDAIP